MNQDCMDLGKTRERISRDQMFIGICQVVAQRSTCLRSQVGAIIVKDGRVVSMGYNGPVSGAPACEDLPNVLQCLTPTSWERWKKKHPLMCMGPGCTRSCHAETNAISFAARSGVAVEGCTLYCTMSPCINCAKVIVNSGIKEVKYLEKYRDTSGVDLLLRSGIAVRHLEGPGWELGT